MNAVLSETAKDFNWSIRVYYEDTDAGGVVFYANYLKFFERARTEWLRTAGIEQSQLVKTDEVMFVVKSTALDYHAPARLDDELNLTVIVEKIGRVAVDFIQQAWRYDEETPKLLATGRIKVVCVNTHTFRPAAIPQRVLDQIRPTQISINDITNAPF
ncbi:tol-pal system-associated acyl-CoA thioesterase [Glaciimonas sp. Gout2]|uniref:tol-pal system-associated acyl-CoA thioesterase n=1 Tax=unclassified Glaciimonas TaxID=2644401 RepID=UPI002B225226|nr:MULTISPECIES: tol-pal system-associated acyl-CoA thioesterase [unclassified Glaciimonas]MEB0012640.1 tol-pal system-associated acyl-CoA thioesterase [Glaciimonas sp. Cout2]MEB0083019.1 tol-pal system-associated acyl-CoA thioesterase [Glaciimonas sp. Gout2]